MSRVRWATPVDSAASATAPRRKTALELGAVAGQRLVGGDADAVEVDGREPARGVDRDLRRDADALGVGGDDVAATVGGGDEEEGGAGRVGDQLLLAVEHDPVAVGLVFHRVGTRGPGRAGVDHRLGAARGPLGERAQPALLLLVGGALRQRQADHGVGEERRGRERVAHLLEEHREVDDPEALAAPLLGQRQPGPAELRHLAPSPARRCRRRTRRSPASAPI